MFFFLKYFFLTFVDRFRSSWRSLSTGRTCRRSRSSTTGTRRSTRSSTSSRATWRSAERLRWGYKTYLWLWIWIKVQFCMFIFSHFNHISKKLSKSGSFFCWLNPDRGGPINMAAFIKLIIYDDIILLKKKVHKFLALMTRARIKITFLHSKRYNFFLTKNDS